MGSTPSSQPTSKSEVIQDEIKDTPEQTKSAQQPYSPIMDLSSTSSSETDSKTGTTQEKREFSQLLTYPFALNNFNILSFLDISTLLLNYPRVCKSCHQHYTKYMKIYYLNPYCLDFLYGLLIFSRGRCISQPTLGIDFRPQYLRSCVNISLKGVKQPREVQIHVLTTSDSEEIHLYEVISMVIDFSSLLRITSDSDSKEVFGFDSAIAKDFLTKLSTNSFGNLGNLKLSGLPVEGWLWESFSNLHLDWLHVICPFFPPNRLNSDTPQGCRKLYLKLGENCDLGRFPYLPSSLEELSLHFSGLIGIEFIASVSHCKCLKKM
jgi:hypothetical protein